MFHHTLRSFVFAGVLAQQGAVLAQELVTLGPEKLERVDEARTQVVFEGFVYSPDGSPAEAAVVMTSAGGKAVVDVRGHYHLEARVPRDAERVQVTAVGSGGRNLVASASVGVSTTSGSVVVDPLELVMGSTCSPSWLPEFGEVPGTDGPVNALAVYDDGGGPALYAGGDFKTAGGVVTNHIARWDGSNWSALGRGLGTSFTGFIPTVHALVVYDDGGGPELYAGGDFNTAGGAAAKGIARWNGSSWSALGSGVSGTAGPSVFALAVYDDGGGRALYAGGGFTTAGGSVANNIARWNGSSWGALGNGMNAGGVFALAVYDDGGGPALYAGGGGFTTAGGGMTHGIARWDGSSWSAVGSGTGGTVLALAVYDDGGGPALYAGTSSVARWDGSSWSALGTGSCCGAIQALAVYDDGGGTALYAGGTFTTAGGGAANNIARWDGSRWSVLGSGMNGPVKALAVYDDGGGPALYAGGDSTTAGSSEVNHIARWDGSSWSALGSGMNSSVSSLAVYDDGGGPALYAGGFFITAGGGSANYIARWNGSSWNALGSGMDGAVKALSVYDDGGGPALYAGGEFTTAGGSAASHIARWDGSSWSALGSGISGVADALAVYDDGRGPALYAGGFFITAGGGRANRIARWDGASWSALGSGMSWHVYALAVYDDGGGPALYAGGAFTIAGGGAANHIARWNGSSWSALGSGMNNEVRAMAVYDDGGGPALYAGCAFSGAGLRIARWDGSRWSLLRNGVDESVFVLAVYDDGRGPALYAGGEFTTADGSAANRIARWNGSSWSALGSGMNGDVTSLAIYDDGGGPALYAGGAFSSAIDSGDSYLARWGCPDTTPPLDVRTKLHRRLDRTPPVLDCPASISVLDELANGRGEIVTFTVTATDDQDPSPRVVSTPSSGSVFPVGTTIVTSTATDASGNESTCQFPVEVTTRLRRR